MTDDNAPHPAVTVSHELKTQLAVFKQLEELARLLPEDFPKEKRLEPMNRLREEIHENAARLFTMIVEDMENGRKHPEDDGD